jgi:TatD DNase family protein
MLLVDTHCHLDPRYFAEGADPPIERARSAGVGALVCIGVGGLLAAEHAVGLAHRRADIVATVGVHPHDALENTLELEASLERLIGDERVVAVGEIGLDYHYDRSPREVQRSVFARYVALAVRHRKPIVIHTRNAKSDTLEILAAEGAREVGGVIHCFSEDREFAHAALELDFDLSFSGILTFKNAASIQDVAGWAPQDRILVETDSPYLSPVPLRGKSCEPAYIVHTARRLAELRGEALERVAELTTANAARRFGSRLAEAVRLCQTGSA